ncbi:VPLPA-CTERM sorting domain-containing protein [Profundibacterium mesophilum]|uniref:VPLPA-CTERM sorting domain-containing protein n=1 Tax=Profundibacterium mesophilum KAUST100406-0324 TaxID=1037889 RepID=A0A921NXK7_9RHOB|nr:VPLPA-CTERM sorting domain-containing protein [Profundibacterium mesophilum]KAF0677553.1 hypothetical protein PMES_00058 [Profundibacterium mesophilum KAUST100406-0324]
MKISKAPLSIAGLATGMLLSASAASAITAAPSTVNVFTVEAQAHSYNGRNSRAGHGPGLATGIMLSFGDAFSVDADPSDDWFLGNPNHRPSFRTNADGAFHNYGSYTDDGLTASFGSLVGMIGDGPVFEIGSAFSSFADRAGELRLFMWDSNFEDNNGEIVASIEAPAPVPLPAAGFMLLAGLGGLGALRLRKTVRS